MNALLVSFAIAVSNAPAQTVQIKFNLTPGTILTYKSTQDADTEAMGTTMKMTSSQTQVYEVKGIEDGWMRIDTKLSEFKMESDGPMGDMMGDPTGLETSFLVSPDRKVTDVKITNNGNLKGDQVDGFRSGVESEAASGLDGLVLHGGDISVGTTWEHELPPVSMAFGNMKSTTEGKLKAIYKVLEINGKGKDQTVTIESKTDGAYTLTIESPSADFNLDVTQKETRTFVVRVRDGVVKNLTIESNRDMSSQAFDVATKSKGKSELVEE